MYSIYIAVLCAVLSCSHEKITIFRGALRAVSVNPVVAAFVRITSAWRGDLAAEFAGAAAPLAFAPVGWWPVSFLSCALLFALWLFSSPARSLWRGFYFGLGFFGVFGNVISITFHIRS